MSKKKAIIFTTIILARILLISLIFKYSNYISPTQNGGSEKITEQHFFETNYISLKYPKSWDMTEEQAENNFKCRSYGRFKDFSLYDPYSKSIRFIMSGEIKNKVDQIVSLELDCASLISELSYFVIQYDLGENAEFSTTEKNFSCDLEEPQTIVRSLTLKN